MDWSGYRIDPEKHPLDFALCGTPGNYRAHLRRGEKACRSCRQAESRRQQDVRRTPRPNGRTREWVKQFRQMVEDVNRDLNRRGISA